MLNTVQGSGNMKIALITSCVWPPGVNHKTQLGNCCNGGAGHSGCLEEGPPQFFQDSWKKLHGGHGGWEILEGPSGGQQKSRGGKYFVQM